MTWRLLELGRLSLTACALAGLFAGCDERPASSDDGEAGNAGAPRSSGATAGANAGGASSLPACSANRDSSPSLPEPSQLDPDVLARAAVVVGSCVPDDGVARNAAHIWREHLGAPLFHRRLGAQLDCLANAACGCTALEQCLGMKRGLAPAAGCAAQCAGDVLSGCEDEQQFELDCGSLGQTCDESLNCVSEPAQACEGTEAPSCSAEGEVRYCSRGIWRTTPCQSVGFSCLNGECVGQGAACDASPDESQVELSGMACSGDTLQACLGERATTVDCTKQGPGFSCQSVSGTFFCGLDAECVPPNPAGAAMPPASCDGDVLTFCSAGRIERLDCTALGFSGCEIDTSVGRYGCVPGAVLQ